ncbi:unnamed protein product [Gadus morhua 'NCC']
MDPLLLNITVSFSLSPFTLLPFSLTGSLFFLYLTGSLFILSLILFGSLFFLSLILFGSLFFFSLILSSLSYKGEHISIKRAISKLTGVKMNHLKKHKLKTP